MLDKVVEILLDALTSVAISALLSTDGTRKLLRQGSCVEVKGTANSTLLHVTATSVRLLSIFPDPFQAALCLSLPLSDAALLFTGDASASAARTDLCLTAALRPCSILRCAQLRAHIAAVPKSTQFQDKQLLQLCSEMRQAQGLTKTGKRPAPLPLAAAWEAVLRLEERWGATRRAGCPAAAGLGVRMGDHEVADLGNAAPMHNLDVEFMPEDEAKRRRVYALERKQPQVLRMLALLSQLTEGSAGLLHMVDVGGGRGDLAVALASTLGPARVRVTVLDLNEKSLAAGRDRAAAAALTNIGFHCCDVTDGAKVSAICGAVPIDAVFGLHCCGGLSEAAMSLALRSGSAFVVCSCCFQSNPLLSTLSTDADDLSVQSVSPALDTCLRAVILNCSCSCSCS